MPFTANGNNSTDPIKDLRFMIGLKINDQRLTIGDLKLLTVDWKYLAG
jgi:hypothetical protein